MTEEWYVVYDVVGFENKDLAKQQASFFTALFKEASAPTHPIRFKVLTVKDGKLLE